MFPGILQVSKRFARLISQSLSLQYKVELAVSRLEDGTGGRFSTAERLQAVYERRRAWRLLDWKYKGIIKVDTALEVYAFCGTHFAWFDSDGKFQLLQIPSKTRHVPEKIQTIALRGVDASRVVEVMIDPDVDLLALQIFK